MEHKGHLTQGEQTAPAKARGYSSSKYISHSAQAGFSGKHSKEMMSLL